MRRQEVDVFRQESLHILADFADYPIATVAGWPLAGWRPQNGNGQGSGRQRRSTAIVKIGASDGEEWESLPREVREGRAGRF
jgi:hypothetical protein